MAGIYIHIPFCKKACTYCNFHFSTSRQLQNDFLQALLKEIRLRKQYLDDAEVETIYFGGGTPSITPPEQIRQILEEIRLHFNVNEQAEVTLEANPDDISTSSVADWFASGINRLSVGIQSFHENDLRWMNRAHNVQQAFDCIDIARAYFKALTIDLIYGTPLLTDEKWHHNIQTALEKGIPHLSCYALTTEEGTSLHHQIKKGLQAEPLQEDQARQFEWLMSTMETNGYEHYEISNFALPGHRSRHNSSYWKEQPYLGLGPSAHSYNGIARQWNIGNNAIYIQQMKENILPVEEEILSAAQQANEYIMLSLRTHEGIDLGRLHMKLNEKGLRKFEIKAGIHQQKGLLEQTETKIILTRSGKLFADGIAADLFVEDSHCTLI